MYCEECGTQLPDGAKFCTNCGARVDYAQKERIRDARREYVEDGQKVTENIYYGTDGKYHWYYELSLLKNPVIFITVCRVLGISIFIVYIFVVCITACDGGHGVMDQIWDITKVFALILCGASVLALVGYLFYIVIAGSHYCVLFEMDEKGVKHTQLPKQFKKADALGTVLALAGLATGKIGRVGQGLMIKGQQSMSSDWNKATSVIINRSQNTIKVNERLFKNQVYAADEDFDFVVDFIKEHVSEKCKISE